MTDRTAAEAELLTIRASIDNIDAAIVCMLAERFRRTRRLAEIEASHGLSPLTPADEEPRIRRLRRLATEARLDPGFAERYFAFIFGEATDRGGVARGG